MEIRIRTRFLTTVSFILVLFFVSGAEGGDFTVSYCSPQNTGITSVFNWTWQSNGKCTDYCNGQGNYAFAVIKWKDCWCSNYIPAQQVDNGLCLKDCPGFPDEKCGDTGKGLYIYIKMDGTPSGTQGLPSSTLMPAKTGPMGDQAQTSLLVVTESGAVVTRTLIVAPTAVPSRTGGNSASSHLGAIVGGILGGILALLAIVGLILFMLWRKRKERREEEGHIDGATGITRNTSQMSKSGLIHNAVEKESQYVPETVTTHSPDGHMLNPVTITDRRYSKPVVVDSRLDPRAVLTFHGSNVSRESLQTIDDSRDYGRQLKVRNPDFENR